jgi:Dimerisation and cyclophilin-binding domain of Mon2
MSQINKIEEREEREIIRQIAKVHRTKNMLSAFLSTELLSLSTECKKLKDTALKDACEEMMVTLREIKQDEKDLGMEIRKRDEGIKVFLMALESKNYKIVVIAGKRRYGFGLICMDVQILLA